MFELNFCVCFARTVTEQLFASKLKELLDDETVTDETKSASPPPKKKIKAGNPEAKHARISDADRFQAINEPDVLMAEINMNCGASAIRGHACSPAVKCDNHLNCRR